MNINIKLALIVSYVLLIAIGISSWTKDMIIAQEYAYGFIGAIIMMFVMAIIITIALFKKEISKLKWEQE